MTLLKHECAWCHLRSREVEKHWEKHYEEMNWEWACGDEDACAKRQNAWIDHQRLRMSVYS